VGGRSGQLRRHDFMAQGEYSKPRAMICLAFV